MGLGVERSSTPPAGNPVEPPLPQQGVLGGRGVQQAAAALEPVGEEPQRTTSEGVDLSTRAVTRPGDGYQAVKEAGNTLVPLLKKRVRKQEGQSFSRQVKGTAMNAVSRVTSTSDRLDPAIAEKALDFAKLSRLSYKDDPSREEMPAGFELATDADVPDELRPYYDERTGILKMPAKGARALLVKGDDGLVVAFAGTQMGRKGTHTMQSDGAQRIGVFDPMYRDAAGIISLLLDHPENQDRTMQLTGHSLGGGLAAFSLIANTPAQDDAASGNRERLSGYGYNPAGLSASYYAALGPERIDRSAGKLTAVRTQGDFVSYSGDGATGRLVKGSYPGEVITLPTDRSTPLAIHGIKGVIGAIEQSDPS